MTIIAYRNFDLLITRAGDQHRAFVVDAPAGEASVFFELPLAPDAVTELGGLAQGVRRHIRPAAAAVPDTVPSLTELGSQLFAAVFADKVGSLLAASLASVAQEQERTGLRLWLRFLARQGNLADAIAKFEEALALDPDIESNPGSAEAWNTLCWFGALYGYATQALDACETAVPPGSRAWRHS